MKAKRSQPRRRRKPPSAKTSKKAKQGSKAGKPVPELPPPPDPPLKETVPLPKSLYNRIHANVRARARCS